MRNDEMFQYNNLALFEAVARIKTEDNILATEKSASERENGFWRKISVHYMSIMIWKWF